MSVLSTFFNGIAPLFRGKGHDILGPAVTLQYAPQRPDLMPTGEYAKIEDQNHRIAVNVTQEGYVLVVQAEGNTRSGVLGGNMLLALQNNRKAAGLVVHGVIRDYAEAATQNFPIWTQDARTTTDYDAQHDLAPLAVNVRNFCCRQYTDAWRLDPCGRRRRLFFPGEQNRRSFRWV